MRTTTSTLSLGAGAAALALIGAAGAAVAQESAIEQCRQMANEELRIACLEEALKDAYRTVPAAEDGPAGERPERERGAAKTHRRRAARTESMVKTVHGTLSRLRIRFPRGPSPTRLPMPRFAKEASWARSRSRRVSKAARSRPVKHPGSRPACPGSRTFPIAGCRSRWTTG